MWLHSVKVAQLLRSVACLHTNQSRSYLNHLVYSQKHNYIPYSTFTITTVQLHVSAINVGHLQVVHEALNDKLYLHVSGGGIYILWDVNPPHSRVDIAYRKVLHVQPEHGQH